MAIVYAECDCPSIGDLASDIVELPTYRDVKCTKCKYIRRVPWLVIQSNCPACDRQTKHSVFPGGIEDLIVASKDYLKRYAADNERPARCGTSS